MGLNASANRVDCWICLRYGETEDEANYDNTQRL